MSDANGELLVRPATSEAAALLILLHGYGSNEHDLFSLSPFFDERLHIVSLRAPIMLAPHSYAWFDLEFAPSGIQYAEGQVAESLRHTAQRIERTIQQQRIAHGQALLLGFSQGAMMCAALIARHPSWFGGAVLLSGAPVPFSLLTQATEEAHRADASIHRPPVFIAHGVYDAVLPVVRGRQLRQQMEQLGSPVTYREYALAHEISEELLVDVDEWLTARVDQLAAHTRAP